MQIRANGFETLDGALYRNGIGTDQLERVLGDHRNRALATLPAILPPETLIYIPEERPNVREAVHLWI